MPIAVIELAFDPALRLDDRIIRWETLAIAAVIVAALVLAAWSAGRTPARDAVGPTGLRVPSPERLRRDDLHFIVVGAVPGAVILGRLAYAFGHADYYAARPDAIWDPTQGSLSLGGAVVGGVITASIVAGFLGAPVGRWAHVAARPLLVALGLGKLASLLAGDGQGQPVELAWAVAFAGPGPWGSLAPAVPSHPSQVYEALGTFLVLAILVVAVQVGAFRRRSGALLLAAVGAWAGVRFVVAFTWRDPIVYDLLRAEQLIAAGIVAATVLLVPFVAWRRVVADRRAKPSWPEPSLPPAPVGVEPDWLARRRQRQD